MPICYQLIGVPGAGKSTWVKNQTLVEDYAYASTDAFVELEALFTDSTYNEVFTAYMPTAVKLMTGVVQVARSEGRDVIWDQTSTTIASRKKKFNVLPHYDHVAVVFPTPDRAILDARLANRPGKNIPHHVMRSMISGFQMPTLAEGFHEIMIVQ